MLETRERLGNYLAADEEVTATYSATLSENSVRTPVTLGVTDRRVLCVSDGDTFVNLALDSIGSIRSRPTTRSFYRGNDHRLLMGIGGVVAVLCVFGVVALASSMFVPVLLPLFVGGLASAEYQRRRMDGIDVASLLSDAKRTTLGDGGDRGRTERRSSDVATDRQVLLYGNGLIAIVSFLAIVVLAPSVFVVLLSLGTVGGVALVEYAYRHASDFDGIEVVRRHEREVRISTDDGTTVYIRCDPSDEVDRELGKLCS